MLVVTPGLLSIVLSKLRTTFLDSKSPIKIVYFCIEKILRSPVIYEVKVENEMFLQINLILFDNKNKPAEKLLF